jgi:hypothetical protein
LSYCARTEHPANQTTRRQKVAVTNMLGNSAMTGETLRAALGQVTASRGALASAGTPLVKQGTPVDQMHAGSTRGRPSSSRVGRDNHGNKAARSQQGLHGTQRARGSVRCRWTPDRRSGSAVAQDAVIFWGFGHQDKGRPIAHHNALTNPSWAVACADAVLRHAAASGAPAERHRIANGKPRRCARQLKQRNI